MGIKRVLCPGGFQCCLHVTNFTCFCHVKPFSTISWGVAVEGGRSFFSALLFPAATWKQFTGGSRQGATQRDSRTCTRSHTHRPTHTHTHVHPHRHAHADSSGIHRKDLSKFLLICQEGRASHSIGVLRHLADVVISQIRYSL